MLLKIRKHEKKNIFLKSSLNMNLAQKFFLKNFQKLSVQKTILPIIFLKKINHIFKRHFYVKFNLFFLIGKSAIDLKILFPLPQFTNYFSKLSYTYQKSPKISRSTQPLPSYQLLFRPSNISFVAICVGFHRNPLKDF